MDAKERLRLVGALLIGAAVAFPAGLWLAGDAAPERRVAAAPADATGFRQPFSPIVLRDPHFLAEQRKGIAALERQCRATGAFCAEAEAGRRWLAEHR